MRAPPPPADPIARASAALREFLVALELPIGSDPELRETPERVARAFYDELLDGYRTDPAAPLADALPSSSDGLVALTHITYASVCPHHLLPSSGVAHVGYLPGGRIVGLGSIVRLVEVCAHRLVLQETLGQRIADALVEHLGARAAGVVLDASHLCMVARGERQAAARVVTQSFAGAWREGPAGRAEFLHAVSVGRPP